MQNQSLLAKIRGAFKSRALWFALGTGLLGYFPAVQAWVAANVPEASTGVMILFGVLRVLTTQSLEDKGNPPGQASSP